MALTGRKLCKLDAICAKLKQSKEDEESSDDRQTFPEVPNESPANLSLKCFNNNIIGKADLNSVDDEINSNGLDLSKKSFEDKTEKLKEDKLIESLDVKDLKKVTDNNNANYLDQTVDKPVVGSSKRKRGIPRSISQVRDLYEHAESDNIEDYVESKRSSPENSDINKTETVFSYAEAPLTDNNIKDEVATMGLSNSRTSNYSLDSDKSRHSSEINFSDSCGTPLDLSINRSNKDDNDEDSINGYLSSDEDVENNMEDDDEDFFRPNRNLVIDEGKSVSQFSECSAQSSVKDGPKAVGNEQEAHLQDYAESTMNELISMYGFGGISSQQNDLSKHVPIKNFTSILQYAQREQLSPASTGGASLSNHPMSSGDEESHDGSQPMKGLYANLSAIGTSSGIKMQGSSKVQNDRFTTSSSFINAVFNAKASRTQNQLSPGLPNYSKYLKRYNNGTECGGQHCKDLGYREHYHCIDCSFQVFVKKEEMVRHYKWHRKREESLQHGFLRFSPVDNCSKRFGPCTHNGKQTHYHCLQTGCDKVYISTSDVQMHANYHRKDSAIMSEGFQRFRATEDCGTMSCTFYGQRTTHFHCLRPECKFTFKNKADMEKHKSYHQKDEVLGRDGFKKFMKYEHCMYPRCRYSKVSNHIHCIRKGCDYVLHSTAQLYSHKRKHERRDFENAYKHFQDTNQASPQSGRSTEKPILPRPDFHNVQQLGNISSNPITQTLATVANLSSGLKRSLDWDQQEPLELKKPKLEQDSDLDTSLQSAPSPQSVFEDVSIKTEPENLSMDGDISSCPEDSKDSSPELKAHFRQIFQDGEGLNLSSSLNLPIPKFPFKSESPASFSGNTSSATKQLQPKPLEMSKGEQMFSVFTSVLTSMPSTVSGPLLAMNAATMMTVPSTFPDPSTVLQPPKSVYTERREKDDSWKTYLVRYTANDPCNPHCQYLYKDHYHCKMQGCLVLFKSKDGVREHARFHELQDRITPIAYQTYEDVEDCPQDCQYSKKEKHFHCIWTGCTHVVPYKGPTFGRLEHYRIHEYARAAAGKSYPRSGKGLGSLDDSSMRRRGRPPKYPKIELPKIPKVELTDEEIQKSQMPLEETDATSKMKVINGFRVFTPEDPCPDDRCSFYRKLHYHCARPRCFTITDRIDVLNLHAKDFHSFVKILEGYEFFDRNVSCRRMHCPNNQTNRHFHCTRPKCDYSFIRHSTMAQHEKKHQYSVSPSAVSLSTKDLPISPKTLKQEVPLLPAGVMTASSTVQSPTQTGVPTSVITASGAFLPVKSSSNSGTPIFISQQGTLTQGQVILSQQAAGGTVAGIPVGLLASSIHSTSVTVPVSTVQALPASVTAPHIVAGLPAPVVTLGGTPVTLSGLQNAADSSNIPLTVLLQRGVNQIPQPSWNDLKAKMHYAVTQNCGRPFCKLKKKDHFHCYECNQAFSDPARLRSHVGKHGLKLKHAEQTLGHSLIAPKLPVPNLNSLNVSNTNIVNNSNNNGTQSDSDLDPVEAQCLSRKASEENDSDVEDTKSSSLNLNPSAFSEMISKAQEQNQMSSAAESDDESSLHIDANANMDENGDQSDSTDVKGDISSRSGRKIIKTKKEGFINSGDINLSKKHQGPLPINIAPKQSPKKSSGRASGIGSRGLRDDTIPDGYSRWRYNEECKYPKCAYRHSVTHFHCVREDCGYGFSDRSRLVQHTLRHERIDSITGGELQQYRINQDCQTENCEYNKKMSHFHCKRCTYSCTDSSKVLTHRKYHAKMDSISEQGFEKYSAADDCTVNLCPYARKQNHFHCVVETCRAAVLGPVQMASHKTKHGN